MQEALIRKKVRVPLHQTEADFYTFYNLQDQKEHLAVAIGDWRKQEVVNIRLHSECLTGEVFHSSKCECGEQLNEAIELFSRQSGVIFYLRQEGRGIGLYNKLDAYELQNQGFDTVEANQKLNFPTDAREYTVALQMLKALGISKVRLLSNNPLKEKALKKNGIHVVSRVSTGIFIKKNNIEYLRAKKKFCDHDIDLSLKQII